MRAPILATVLLAVTVSLGSTLASPSRAEAQFGTGSYTDLVVGLGIGAGLLVGVPTLLFTVADCVSFGQESPFARGWAIFELGYASFEILMGLGTVSGGITVATGGSDGLALTLSSLVPLAFGALHLAHGVWSLETLGSRAREGPAEEPRARITFGPASVGVALEW